MMKYKIPYLSKKKNPNAGQTVHYHPGVVSYEYDEQGNIIAMGRELITYRTIMPSPDYLYEYNMNIAVSCSACGSIFAARQLVNDLDEDSDGSWNGSPTTCPFCKEGYCCELEYEQ